MPLAFLGKQLALLEIRDEMRKKLKLYLFKTIEYIFTCCRVRVFYQERLLRLNICELCHIHSISQPPIST